jgi:predicted 3-demethylubiquinone-9 3-methyltransferase (glyoxalase superfamily)
MQFASKIVPCLWFDQVGEEAAKFYTGIFPDSRITHANPVTVAFELAGQPFTALNGGPHFKFNESVSLQVMCDSAEEVDHFWSALGEGGSEQQCGWLKDRFGLSWQIIPKRFIELVTSPDQAAVQRTFAAMMKMKKLDLPRLEQAFNAN